MLGMGYLPLKRAQWYNCLILFLPCRNCRCWWLLRIRDRKPPKNLEVRALEVGTTLDFPFQKLQLWLAGIPRHSIVFCLLLRKNQNHQRLHYNSQVFLLQVRVLHLLYDCRQKLFCLSGYKFDLQKVSSVCGDINKNLERKRFNVQLTSFLRIKHHTF